MHIVFYGPEGSGKGTQAKLVSEKFRIPHLVSGNLVRKYAKEDTGIMGKICKEALYKGHYVADSEMYVLWKQRFKEKDTEKGLSKKNSSVVGVISSCSAVDQERFNSRYY